ncbi:TPA: oligosaccharide flippase family protein [Citrobacter amalonaticus]|jgi:O-antigen/teichoic acid export membrane protein|uniref:oligosaccharide flippase family protein n=1 Tax=Citrobacter amalonaticus TaxID=35703 RepID=UPI0028BF88F7|nr:oligosaccharide flippase family protein [Citrobacter amalonaticus]HBU6575559.1 oligosaccharide flippase family protein [Citrobacter amalonaticus]
MAEKYGNVIFLALFTFIMAKFLKVEEFGIISNADAIVAIISVFSFQGLEQLVQRELVNRGQDEAKIMGAALIFKMPGILLGLLIAIIWGLYTVDPRLSICIYIFSGLIVARSLTVLAAPLISKDFYIKYTVIGISTYATFFVFKIIILFLYPSITIIAVTTVCENLALALLYYLFRGEGNRIQFRGVNKYLQVYLREGFYLIFSGAMVVIYTKTDQLYIANFMSYKVLADYAIALKFLMIYIIPSTIFTLSYVSKLNKGSDDYKKYSREMLIWSVIIGVVFGAICAFTTPFIIEFLYGSKYVMAKEYIVGLSIVVPFCFLLNSTGRIFMNEGMGSFLFQRNLIALSYNVIAGYFLIKYIGAWGGVVAIVSSYAVSALIMVACNKKSRNIVTGILLKK